MLQKWAYGDLLSVRKAMPVRCAHAWLNSHCRGSLAALILPYPLEELVDGCNVARAMALPFGWTVFPPLERATLALVFLHWLLPWRQDLPFNISASPYQRVNRNA